MIVVRVPASSANLGPGFDVLGMALALVRRDRRRAIPAAMAAATPVDDRHPAQVAFRIGGGEGAAVGALADPGRAGARLQRRDAGGWAARGAAPSEMPQRRSMRLAVLAILRRSRARGPRRQRRRLDLGGRRGDRRRAAVVPVPLAFNPTVVVWVPRDDHVDPAIAGALPETVSFADAVFNVGRTALFVAALAAGDVAALRTATEDRLAPGVRFAATSPSAVALAAGSGGRGLGGWLSGSGPTVAALCDPGADGRRHADVAT